MVPIPSKPRDVSASKSHDKEINLCPRGDTNLRATTNSLSRNGKEVEMSSCIHNSISRIESTPKSYHFQLVTPSPCVISLIDVTIADTHADRQKVNILVNSKAFFVQFNSALFRVFCGFYCAWVRVDPGYDMAWVRLNRGYELTWYELTLGTS